MAAVAAPLMPAWSRKTPKRPRSVSMPRMHSCASCLAAWLTRTVCSSQYLALRLSRGLHSRRRCGSSHPIKHHGEDATVNPREVILCRYCTFAMTTALALPLRLLLLHRSTISTAVPTNAMRRHSSHIESGLRGLSSVRSRKSER